MIFSENRFPLFGIMLSLLQQPPQRTEIVERDQLVHVADPEDREDHGCDNRGPDQLGLEREGRRRAGIVPRLDVDPLLGRIAHAERQHDEQRKPPDDEVDCGGGGPGHQRITPLYACSISTSVPQKSFGCRNSTGLPCAPILGLPSPSTRAPSALSLSRAARMSSTS